MKKTIIGFTALVLLASCYNVKTPLLLDNSVSGAKTGQVCAKVRTWFYVDGDISVEAAKKAGNITKVATVNTFVDTTLGFGNLCTIVTGN